MNDIKIMSRGGAKLSEILPNYILKGQEKRVCSLRTNFAECTDATTSAPGTREQSLDVSVTCPSQYKAAVVVIPLMVGVNFLAPKSAGGPFVTTTSEPDVTPSGHTHEVSFAKRRFAITLSESAQDYVKGVATDSATQTKTFNIQMGYMDAAGLPVKPSHNENVEVIIQTYCVFDESAFTSLPEKERGARVGADGGTDISKIKTQVECVTYGGEWSASTNACANKP